ncbi:MAG TPA: endolytic transglycosylase MltG [Firmicutes bacterium]|nr:endolytic transglycosylase MltG [Candidatus Fermentithermobacillaceae bacterium]
MRAPGAQVESPRRRSRLAIYCLGLLIVLLLASLSIFSYLSSCPLPETAGPVSVMVEPGMSTREVAKLLEEQGVIRSDLFFRILARMKRADGLIQSGEYSFGPGIHIRDVLDSLVEGRVIYYSLTVREGLSVEQIAALVEEKGFGTKEAFLEAASDRSLAPDYVPAEYLETAKYPLEGYLFPDTYYIRRGMTERDIVLMMLKRMDEVFTEEMREKARAMNLTPHGAATLASIVEREAQVAWERPVIAAVYLNRLRIGMKLDADPTVLYALGKPPNALVLWKDLEVDSPYNTYKYPGLPPGPICNFGKASLEAVLAPEDVDYLYFVAKNDGTHAFARTLAEHNLNRATYQGR